MSPPSIAAASLIFFFFVVPPLTFFHRSCGASASNTTYDLRTNLCSASGGSLSDPYQANLGRFLAALPSNAINNSGFFNGTFPAGSSTTTTTTGNNNKVFGMAMCQADIHWPDQCQSCLQALSAKARMACPSSSKVRAASWGCVLHYSDVPIFPDIVVAFNCTRFHGPSVPDITSFTEVRNELLTDLARKAVASQFRIASDNRTFNDTHNLYGLAQCNRDWEVESCFNVITSFIQNMGYVLPPDALWSEGVSITGFNFFIRYDLTRFVHEPPPTGAYVPPSAHDGTVETIIPAGGPVEIVQGTVVMKVATIVPISISIIVLFVVVLCMRNHQNNKEMAQNLKLAGIQIFTYGNIRSATRNFTTLIGEGGFGRVYMGTFNIDGEDQVLAVKCVTNPWARKQLLDELETLARIDHNNVVKLKGFCNNQGWFSIGKYGRGLYICSDFMSRRSLDTHIFDWANNPHGSLKWSIRYEIIRGICEGLKHLHKHGNNITAHLDLKPSNILLDQTMKPKIADFGLSRTFSINRTHTYTSATTGTNEYMAPELTEPSKNNKLNVGCKWDIYTLGVLTMAIVMGKASYVLINN